MTIFRQIIDKKLPAEIIYEDDSMIVIKDIHPQAPIHWLLIAKIPLKNLKEAEEKHSGLLASMLLTAGTLAENHQMGDFRIVINNGSLVGQTVFHLHMHLLAGKAMDGLC